MLTIPNLARVNYWIFAVCLIAAVFSNPGSGHGAEREIAWTEDYDASVQRSAASNSILLLHFYGDYCPPCKLLDKKTFKDPALVAAINANLVPVKINADRRRDLAEKYQVNRWPTDVYLLPNGDELYRGISDQDASVYTQKIKRLVLRHRDWSLEREAIAKTTERRQEKQIAATSPRTQGERPVYAGSAGLPVSSQADSWKIPHGQPANVSPYEGTSQNQPTHQPAPIVNNSRTAMPRPTMVAANKQQRVIDNPYIEQRPSSQPAPHSPQPSPQLAYPIATQPNLSAQLTSNPQNQPIPENSFRSNESVQHVPSQLGQVERNSSQSGLSNIPALQKEPTQDDQLDKSLLNKHILADTIGLEGYCPVELTESLTKGSNPTWTMGSPAFAVRHRGREYHCSSEKARQTLLSAPDKYTPCLSCYDLVHFFQTFELIDGKCQFGCIQPETNRVFLFATQENLKAFELENDRYSQIISKMNPERVANRLEETQVR